MSFLDWLGERKLFGLLLIVGFIALLHEFIYHATQLSGEAITILSAGIGVMGTAIGIIVQSIWKTGAAEQAQSAALNAVATGTITPSPTPNPTPAPEGPPH